MAGRADHRAAFGQTDRGLGTYGVGAGAVCGTQKRAFRRPGLFLGRRVHGHDRGLPDLGHGRAERGESPMSEDTGSRPKREGGGGDRDRSRGRR